MNYKRMCYEFGGRKGKLWSCNEIARDGPKIRKTRMGEKLGDVLPKINESPRALLFRAVPSPTRGTGLAFGF